MSTRTPIPVPEAISRVIEKSKAGGTERVQLKDTIGRYLAEDIVADHPIPHFNRSAFDGFAIRSDDTLEANFENPIELKLIESIAAGQVATKEVGSHEATRIMTGAQVPIGADAILALELSETLEKEGEVWVRLNRPIPKGTHISEKGEDVQEGAILAHKGRRISAGEMAMLAMFGYHEVQVYKQPIVGIFVTGTELLPVEAEIEPGKIRNSNSYMLESQIKALGGIPQFYGLLPDDFELCYREINEALKKVDYLITTGGASVGDFDYVQDIVAKLGADTLFNKIAMRPGSVTTVATLGDKWIFGLSGNPAACFVGFELFARPVLRTFSGSKAPHLPRSKARLSHAIKKPNPFTRFTRAKAELQGSQVVVSSIGVDKSGIASALVEANALLVVPGGTRELKEGEELEIIWLDRYEEGYKHV
ncbi:gephyrin-like molybdotransferase Glp [Bacillus horti]|uniref:Molybdopterin molybdenumtransferase n=1 Tax=Caldalkalibacillus horti TaxID=77523 RepID=A0ABT9W3G7_9BACI|nr:gephyrin-like molybdotransferase Glp [Bacillus horti]MDQ0167772.1 molybdopterin molybdotransferase [Bacillus horti]